MNRRQFNGTIAGCLLTGGASAATGHITTSASLLQALPVLGPCRALPDQMVFREICGQYFQAQAVTTTGPGNRSHSPIKLGLQLQTVDPARTKDQHQFYLRFRRDDAAVAPAAEGIYRLSSGRYELMLYLTPVNGHPGQMEAVVNTQRVHA